VNSLDFGTAKGFTLGSLANVNALGDPFVGWAWDEGAIPGLDIIKYAGDSVNDRGLPHSLGKFPFMVIVKPYDLGDSWRVWHWAASQPGDSAPRDFYLENNAPWSSPRTAIWTRIPDATNIYLSNNAGVNNSSHNYVAYVWSEIPGFSKFGWYNGNARGDEGSPFIACGFKPAFIMLKRVDAAGDWITYDAKRGVNPSLGALFPNLQDAEITSVGLDFVSNGFKLRRADNGNNISGARYVFMAFAEAPYKYANAR
jgi:hypothetical protein